jgi:hypothetical protein
MIRIVFGRAPVAETIALAYSQALERNHELPQAREVLETSLKSHPDQFSIRLHCRPSKSSTTPMFPGKIPKCLSCSQQLASNSANKRFRLGPDIPSERYRPARFVRGAVPDHIHQEYAGIARANCSHKLRR